MLNHFVIRCSVVAIFAAVNLYSQAVTGDLVVSVADPSGSTVAGARLTLTQIATNVRFEQETDSLGNYIFVQLQPGAYRLAVSREGFQGQTLDSILIQVGQRACVDVRLAVGQVSESVTVLATEVTLLNAESASVGQVLEQKSIVELPLNGRNFIQPESELLTP